MHVLYPRVPIIFLLFQCKVHYALIELNLKYLFPGFQVYRFKKKNTGQDAIFLEQAHTRIANE